MRPWNRSIVGTQTRGAILRALTTQGTWHGRRRGIHMKFSLSTQPTLSGERIEWQARINKSWEQGKAGNVQDAIRAIEQAAYQTKEPSTWCK